MKLLILFLLSSWTILTAQTNFIIVDSDLIWQKVYETDLKPEQIQKQLKQMGGFNIESVNDNELHLNILRTKIDYTGAGYKKWGLPAYLAMNDYIAFAMIQFKEGKYRVTVKKIKLIQKENHSTTIGGNNIDLYSEGAETAIEEYTIKNSGDYKNQFIKTGSIVLDYTFNNLFEIKEATTDDW